MRGTVAKKYRKQAGYEPHKSPVLQVVGNGGLVNMGPIATYKALKRAHHEEKDTHRRTSL